MTTATLPDPAQPEAYPRRVLVAATGLSPQVVTETLYALATKPRPFVPTEVHVITTGTGAEGVRLSLLSDGPGWFARLCADYALPPIAFDASHVHVMRGTDGEALDDLRTPADNEAAADAITALLRELTADDGAALHVSLAGGRKTMGFYIGYALSLYGRAQDRLSHVLVASPFEQSLQFFYPSPTSRVIEVGRQHADAADARVTLAEIPFVSLRHGLPRALLEGRASFADTVAAARTHLAPPELVLFPRSLRIQAAGRTLQLPPAQFALLAVLAQRARRGAPKLRSPVIAGADPAWVGQYLADLRAACGTMGTPGNVEESLRDSTSPFSHLQEQRSRLQKTLKDVLGEVAALPYLVEGKRGHGYRLALPANAIRFALDDGIEGNR